MPAWNFGTIFAPFQKKAPQIKGIEKTPIPYEA
jgi:hypothetical protein